MDSSDIPGLLLVLAGIVAPILLTWKDRKDPATRKAIAATSLFISMTRWRGWGK